MPERPGYEPTDREKETDAEKAGNAIEVIATLSVPIIAEALENVSESVADRFVSHVKEAQKRVHGESDDSTDESY